MSIYTEEMRVLISTLDEISCSFSSKETRHIGALIDRALVDLDLALDHISEVECDERDENG